MLIEFSVENYRSIGERQRLSLRGKVSDDSHPKNVVGRSNGDVLLKSAVIYGANASGKSNLVRAIRQMRRLVVTKPEEGPDGLDENYNPFIFDSGYAEKPTTFEIIFDVDGIRYKYAYSLNRTTILTESLYAYPNGVQQKWYERLVNEDGLSEFNVSKAHFKRDRESEKRTRADVLFLSMATVFNHPQLQKVHSWFRNQLQVISLASGPPLPTRNIVSPGSASGKEISKRIRDLIVHSDLGILDVIVKEVPYEIPPEVAGVFTPDFLSTLMKETATTQFKYEFVHGSDGKEAGTLPITEESDGTQKLFAMAGTWFGALATEKCLIIDEIDASLHPSLLRHLIEEFHNISEANEAQIVCTTHDTNLLDQCIFRRDQVFFVEKDVSLQSKVYALTEFQPRKDESLAKGYLGGRYGAIPFFGTGMFG